MPQKRCVLLSIGRERFVAGPQPSAELIDVSFVHRAPVLPQHFGKVFGKDIDLLLQKKERRFDRTQLSLVDDKGEFFHRDLTAFISILSGYSCMRQKQGSGGRGANSPADPDIGCPRPEKLPGAWPEAAQWAVRFR